MLKRVLIAMDDAAAREETKRSLSCWGYEAITAADGLEAWKVLQGENAPRIALLDADLAGLDAFELCRRARDLSGDDTFLLVLAAPNEKSEHLEALEAGADGVVDKPVHPRELRMRLAAGMRGRRVAVSDSPASNALASRDPSDETLAGRIVARKYQLERIVGRGGMGTVWQGKHLSLGMRVAIKFIKGDYARHSVARARFELEARAAASLRTKYAVKVFDCGVTTGGVPYLVMEYLEGQSLLHHVLENGPLSFEETVTLVTQAAQALGEAHSLGIIHRDVKPDNVLLVKDPDGVGPNCPLVAKLIDFGVVKMLPQSEADSDDDSPPAMPTGMGVVVGTPNFMAPEQLRGGVQPDAAADLWALAACAFTAITGRIPFEGSTLSEVLYRVCESQPPVPSARNSDVPREFDEWFARACDPDPTKRFQSARELATSLARAYADYADACIDLTPSLTRFVAHRSSGAALTTRTPATTARTAPTTRRLFDLDEPLMATTA
jgi:serine/threonine protein kinase